jgi:hypothetical protein
MSYIAKWPLLVAVALMAGCAADIRGGSFDSLAKESSSVIVVPEPEVPAKLARLSGTWQGLLPIS